MITQADVDAGFVANTATASATKPGGATVTSNPSSTDTAVVQALALQLTKSAVATDANSDGKTDLGDTVTWSFLVKNTGHDDADRRRRQRPEGRRRSPVR